jgi:hypothetical protein
MRYALIAGVLLLATGRLLAPGLVVDSRLPSYEPGPPVSGNIVCAGNHATDETILTWAKQILG